MKHSIFLCLFVSFSVNAAGASAEIEWQPWSKLAFDQAIEMNQLIFLDVGTEWCSACNQMEEETYQDEQVRKILAEKYVSVRVDAEAEPDLGERYGFWGWPSLIFIKPNGDHVGFFRGYRPPDDFANILFDLDGKFQTGELPLMPVEVDLVSPPSQEPVKTIVGLANSMIDRFYDADNHGWVGARMADQFLMQQAWWRGESEKQKSWTNRALASSNLYLNMLDGVWGGVWFGSRSPDMRSDYIYEKRTEHQASVLAIFANAYQRDKDPKWLAGIDAVFNYLDSFMLASSGAYYTSQEQHVYLHNGETTPADYFALNDEERRKIGLPNIDKTAFTDINAKLVVAFCKVFEATGETKYLQQAIDLIGVIRKQSEIEKGRYHQVMMMNDDLPAPGSRMRALPSEFENTLYLRTQAYVGLAALALLNVTGNLHWLDLARSIEKESHQAMYDHNSGGMLASSRKKPAPGGREIKDQPLIDTAAYVDFLTQLAAYSHGAFQVENGKGAENYQSLAESALRAVAAPERLRVQGNFIGQFVLAAHQLNDEFIQVNIVCRDHSSSACTSLIGTAQSDLIHARKLTKIQDPGYYPDRGEATLFICNSQACSSPISGDDPMLTQKAFDYFDFLDSSS